MTTVKYDGATGNVIWWTDSGRPRNAGVYLGGVYYEFSGNITAPLAPCFLRTINTTTGAEIDRRTFSTAFSVGALNVSGSNLYVQGGGLIVHKINTTDLSSTWTFSQSWTGGGRSLIQGDIVVYKKTGGTNWAAYQNGTTHLWDLATSNIDNWHFIDGSGQYVGSQGTTLKRYDGTPSLVDSYNATRAILNAQLSGTDIWLRSFSSLATGYVHYIDNSLSDNFTPTSLNGGGGGMIVPVSGAAYLFERQYVNRVTTGGSVSQRLDSGGTELVDWLLHADQSTFEVLGDTVSGYRMRSYDDSSAPASLDWTIVPTVDVTGRGIVEPQNNQRSVSMDSNGDIYVTGTRMSDVDLGKVAS